MGLRHNRAKAALVGLLVLFPFSLAAAWGRKPLKEEKVIFTPRHISANEAMEILQKFPELVPDYLASRRNDTAYMAGMFGFLQVTAPPLERIFPAVRFYRGRHFEWRPPPPYMMAIAGDKSYGVYTLNQLLVDNGLNVTDKNVIELTKIFVVLAVMDENRSFPEITFLDARRTSQRINGMAYDVKLETKTGEKIEDWYIDTRFGGLASAFRGNARGLVKQYLFARGEPPPKQ